LAKHAFDEQDVYWNLRSACLLELSWRNTCVQKNNIVMLEGLAWNDPFELAVGILHEKKP